MSTHHQHDRDQDPVWSLVDQASTTKASPLFARNVMREIRLDAATPAPWWTRFLTPVPLTAGALAAAAAFAILVAVQGPDPAPAPVTDAPVATPATEFDLDRSLLIAAAEDPSLFSDEELLALLY